MCTARAPEDEGFGGDSGPFRFERSCRSNMASTYPRPCPSTHITGDWGAVRVVTSVRTRFS